MGIFLNMGNRCTKRRLAGLNIVHEVMVQVRLRKRKGNKSHSHERKVLTPSRNMSGSSRFKGMKRLCNYKTLVTKKRTCFILFLFCYQCWLKPMRRALARKRRFSALFFKTFLELGHALLYSVFPTSAGFSLQECGTSWAPTIPTVFSQSRSSFRVFESLTQRVAINGREGHTFIGLSPSFQLMTRTEVEQLGKVPRRVMLEQQQSFAGKSKVWDSSWNMV